MKSLLRVIILSALTLVITSGCMEDSAKSSGGSGNNDKTGGSAVLEQFVIDNVAQNVILASYRDLRDRTKDLAEAATTLQANPSQAGLEAVQLKWKAARVPWESTEGFLFGPVKSLAVDPSIDSWPLSKIDLDKILQTRPNIDAAFVRSLGTDVQGFHTAEYLIFGEGVNSNNKTIEEMTPAQMSYLTAVTQVLSEQTQKLYVSWTERHDPSDTNSKAYIDIVQKPGLDNVFYPSRAAVLQEFVQGMIKIANEVGRGKLSNPLGGDADHADPSLVESQFSWNSLVDFRNNIQSMENLYTGSYDNRKGAGLDAIVKIKNPEINSKVLAQIETAKQAITDIAGPEGLSFTKAIRDENARARIRSAIASLATLEATLQDELLPLFK